MFLIYSSPLGLSFFFVSSSSVGNGGVTGSNLGLSGSTFSSAATSGTAQSPLRRLSFSTIHWRTICNAFSALSDKSSAVDCAVDVCANADGHKLTPRLNVA